MRSDIVFVLAIWACASVDLCSAFGIPSFFRRKTPEATSTADALRGSADTRGVENTAIPRADDFLIMPHMMMTMGRISKKLPIEYRPVPLIVGTKQEIDQLREELKLPVDYPRDMDPKTPDDQILSMPLTLGQISPFRGAVIPSRRPANGPPTMTQSASGSASVPANRSDKVGLEDLLPLLRTHPIPTLVHDEPALILNIMRMLTGPKPDGSRAPNEQIDAEALPKHMQNLLRLAARNPQLVRTLAKFDPQFIPNLVNAILGIDNDDDGDDNEGDQQDKPDET